MSILSFRNKKRYLSDAEPQDIPVGSPDAVITIPDTNLRYYTLDTIELDKLDKFPQDRFTQRDNLWDIYESVYYNNWSLLTNETVSVAYDYPRAYTAELVAKALVDRPYIVGLEDDEYLNERLYIAADRMMVNLLEYGLAYAVGVNDEFTLIDSWDTKTSYPADDGIIFADKVRDPDSGQITALDVYAIPFFDNPYRELYEYNGTQITGTMGDQDLPDIFVVHAYRPPERNQFGTSMYESIMMIALECNRRWTANSMGLDITSSPFIRTDMSMDDVDQLAREISNIEPEAWKQLDERERIRRRQYGLRYRQYGGLLEDKTIRGGQIDSWNFSIADPLAQIEKLEAKMDARIGIPLNIPEGMDRTPTAPALSAMEEPETNKLYELRERARLAMEAAIQVVYEGAELVWGNEEPEPAPMPVVETVVEEVVEDGQ